MARIIQYRPDFVSGFENEVVEFNSTDELFAIPFVENFKLKDFMESKFYQFSYNEYSPSQPEKRYVMLAEYDNGKVWYVIGFTDENEIIKTLPLWTNK